MRKDWVGSPSPGDIIAADFHHSNSEGGCILLDADSSQVLGAEVSQAPLRSDQALKEEVGSPKNLYAAPCHLPLEPWLTAHCPILCFALRPCNQQQWSMFHSTLSNRALQQQSCALGASSNGEQAACADEGGCAGNTRLESNKPWARLRCRCTACPVCGGSATWHSKLAPRGLRGLQGRRTKETGHCMYRLSPCSSA